MSQEKFDRIVGRCFGWAWFMFWFSLTCLLCQLRLLAAGSLAIMLACVLVVGWVIRKSMKP